MQLKLFTMHIPLLSAFYTVLRARVGVADCFFHLILYSLCWLEHLDGQGCHMPFPTCCKSNVETFNASCLVGHHFHVTRGITKNRSWYLSASGRPCNHSLQKISRVSCCCVVVALLYVGLNSYLVTILALEITFPIRHAKYL